MKRISKLLAITLLSAGVQVSEAQTVDYAAEVVGWGSTGDFAPYFIGSLNNGRTTRDMGAMLDLRGIVAMDTTRRWSWGAGAEVIAGYQGAADYARYTAGTWSTVSNRPSALWIQQLYGEVKYRGVFLRVGQKDPHSAMLDETLSSGDLTRSSNARGIPGAEVGFIDFQDIPFTNGWVQIQGVVEYGIMRDDEFNHEQFNHYRSVWTSDLWYTYKRCYFRTKPTQPLSITVGMQTAGQFAGTTMKYVDGVVTSTENRGFAVKDIFKMFFPTQGTGSDGFYEGNSLGSWDFKARYRIDDSREVSFAFQWPWEDGSGIGRRNGWDGLYGLYYNTTKHGIITGAAIEYLDFTNHCGAIHWAPGDMPGTTLTGEATGGDDYYNNETFGAFSNYGLSIGTPFLVSPLYNLNGYPMYAHNRARGIHVAVRGYLAPDWEYSVKYSWQEAWGSGRIPATHALIDNSMMVTAGWDAHSLAEGLKINARVAFDAGRLRGDSFGALVGITYSGNLSLNKR